MARLLVLTHPSRLRAAIHISILTQSANVPHHPVSADIYLHAIRPRYVSCWEVCLDHLLSPAFGRRVSKRYLWSNVVRFGDKLSSK